MITHPERDVLLAHADGELADDEDREVGTHVAACAVCSRELTSLQDDAAGFAALMGSLDALEPQDWRSPTVGASDGTHAAGSSVAGGTTITPLRPDRGLRAAPGRPAILRWAAGVLLTTAVAASAAVVALDAWRGTEASTTTPPAAASRPAAVDEGVATVIATPAAGALAVSLSNAGAGARLYITVDDDVPPSVAVTGTDAPRFTAVAGRVDVLLAAGSSVVRVSVPSGLERVEVTLDGAVVATITRGSVSPAAAATADGIPLDRGDVTTGDTQPE